jgi:preprotein translocase subunit SecD
MITTFILYLFGSYSGTSIITGFALTLFIGVCVSMFTAITVTRTFLRLVVGTGIAHDPWWFGVNKLPEAPGAAPAAAD